MEEKAVIKPQTEGYVASRTSKGTASKICGDTISTALAGSTLEEAYGVATTVLAVEEGSLQSKYNGRNPGQQRMILGNLLRGALKGKDEVANAETLKVFEKATKAIAGAVAQRTKDAAKAKRQAAEDKAEKIKEAKKLDNEAKALEKANKVADKANKAADKAADKVAAKAAKPPKKAPAPKAPSKPVELSKVA